MSSREYQGKIRKLQLTMQNNRGKQWIGKIRGFFRKIGDIKGIFHARMGMLKDRNNKELTEKKKR